MPTRATASMDEVRRIDNAAQETDRTQLVRVARRAREENVRAEALRELYDQRVEDDAKDRREVLKILTTVANEIKACSAENKACRKENAALRAEVKRLTAKIEGMEARLAKIAENIKG